MKSHHQYDYPRLKKKDIKVTATPSYPAVRAAAYIIDEQHAADTVAVAETSNQLKIDSPLIKQHMRSEVTSVSLSTACTQATGKK